MPEIHEIIPDAEQLLALEPEELAPAMLQFLCSGGGGTLRNSIKRGNLFLPSSSPANAYPLAYRDRVNEALMATWVWLEHQGLLLPVPGNHDRDWVFVSQRGRELLSKEKFEAYRFGLMFPRTLHPAISSNTFASFMRGHYDTVVFEAFRAVEVAVREAAGLPQDLVGMPLMRTAFHVDTGELTDKRLVKAERQSMSDIFAGAMGLFKKSDKPPDKSHRFSTRCCFTRDLCRLPPTAG